MILTEVFPLPLVPMTLQRSSVDVLAEPACRLRNKDGFFLVRNSGPARRAMAVD